MCYGIIFWGNSSCSEDIFKIRKRIVRLIMNSGKKASCRQLFRELNILPVQSRYILSILLFVAKNKEQLSSCDRSDEKRCLVKCMEQVLARKRERKRGYDLIGGR
jgi:hypothetical protein